MTPRTVESVSGMMRAGNTQQQIADYFGIHVKSLWRWRRRMGMPSLRPDPMQRHVDALYDRWINDHDIRGIGERAVRETA